ncbi:hypothetical protein C8J57DRAFT_1256004 [Mycena rebaudengoi]|nr:hypothetical protein C8J57DRAFT_1256004 [Mycena rebaudengoi]
MTSVETFAFASWTLPEAVINVHDVSGVQAVSFHGCSRGFLASSATYPGDDGVQAEQRRRWWSLAWLKHLCGDLLDSRIQVKDAGVGTILELEPDTSGGGGGALLDSKIAAEDAGVGTILELDPDISGGGGEASARSTERLNVLQ